MFHSHYTYNSKPFYSFFIFFFLLPISQNNMDPIMTHGCVCSLMNIWCGGQEGKSFFPRYPNLQEENSIVKQKNDLHKTIRQIGHRVTNKPRTDFASSTHKQTIKVHKTSANFPFFLFVCLQRIR